MDLLDRWCVVNLATTREQPTGRQDMRVGGAATTVMVTPTSLARASSPRQMWMSSTDGDERHRPAADTRQRELTTSVSAGSALAPGDSCRRTRSRQPARRSNLMDRNRLTTRLAVTVAVAATTAAMTMPARSAAPPAVDGTTGVDSLAARIDDRGGLVSARHLRTMSAERAAAWLASDRFDPGTVRYGVDTWRLVYRTIDPQGRPTVASGLLALPRNRARRLRAVSFTHGTELFKGDAPSTAGDVWGPAPAVTYASAGFAAVAPDYLGLGVGPGTHPWMHKPSETTAALDLLRAARGFVARRGRALERKVLVTGFSQGASAAMSLARALQAGADPRFGLRAVAPVSGGYDFEHAQLPATLNGEIHPKASVIYLSYLLVAWNRLHHLYRSPAEVFQAPYDRTIERLFDNRHSGEEVVAGTPDDLGRLLTPHGFRMLRRPTGRLATALRVADSTCSDWTPRVPVRLYMAAGDEPAVNANSLHCQEALRTHGVDAPLHDVGPVGHLDSNRLGTAAVVRWFLQLR
jgi:Secretory lipase